MKRIVWKGRQEGQHDFLCDMAPGWTLYQGGLGCLAGDTVLDGTTLRMGDVAEMAGGQSVQTTRGRVTIPRGVPVRREATVVIELSDGRTITCNRRHRLFADGAWTCCHELRLGASVLCRRHSIADTDRPAWLADDPRSSRTDEGCSVDYLPVSRLHGQRLLTDQVSDQARAPSQADARGRSLQHSHADAAGDAIGRSHSGPRSDRLAMLNCVRLDGLRDSEQGQGSAGSAGSFLPSRQPARLCLQFAIHAHAGGEYFSRNDCSDRSHCAIPWAFPCDTPLADDRTTVRLRVKRISAGKTEWVYDVHVPGVHHYAAGGVYHHNSGKTWAAARKFLAMHTVNGAPSMAIAPTYADLWRFIVPELQAACDEWGMPIQIKAYGSGEERYCHAVVRGQKIYLMSGDAPKRIAGFEVGLIWIDEGARVKEDSGNPTNDAPTQARARLRHKRARLLAGMVSTTPEGMETWIQRDWFDVPKPDHRSYRGTTAGNDTLPTSYIESLRATFAADLATQYLDGLPVNYSRDRAHATFAKATHVRACKPDPSLPIELGADFNVQPMCWVVCQKHGDRLVVLDEVVLDDNAQVDRAVHALKDRGWGSGWTIKAHPDRSAKSRSTTGDPEIAVMKATARALGMNLTGDAFGVNPPINGRINLICRMLQDAAGVVRLTIDPKCTRLIEDLEKTARGPNGYLPGKDEKRGHILDALGYVAWDLFQPAARATVANWKLG